MKLSFYDRYANLVPQKENFTNMVFDIVVVAGQSNSEGNGVSLETKPLIISDAYEIIDKNKYGMKLKEDGSYAGLDFVYPVEVIIRELQERKVDDKYNSDLSLSFVEKYKKSKFYNPNRKILVIKTGYGGSGFAFDQHGVGNPLYKRMIDMINIGLSLNKDNRIVAFLWHQGEHDAFENAHFSYEERYEYYYSNLLKEFLAVKEEYKQFDFPIITGGLCRDWIKRYKTQSEAVEKATIDVCGKIGNAAFVKTSDLPSNEEELHNGDLDHFSKKSILILGERYFDAFAKLKKE